MKKYEISQSQDPIQILREPIRNVHEDLAHRSNPLFLEFEADYPVWELQ